MTTFGPVPRLSCRRVIIIGTWPSNPPSCPWPLENPWTLPPCLAPSALLVLNPAPLQAIALCPKCRWAPRARVRSFKALDRVSLALLLIMCLRGPLMDCGSRQHSCTHVSEWRGWEAAGALGGWRRAQRLLLPPGHLDHVVQHELKVYSAVGTGPNSQSLHRHPPLAPDPAPWVGASVSSVDAKGAGLDHSHHPLYTLACPVQVRIGSLT